MSLFNKDVSENLCLKEIEKFVYFLNDTFTVAYLSKPFNFISEKIFNNLNFRNFIEIYEINLEKINYYCPWVKARNFIEIKNIIEKICTYKNMNFKKFKKNNFLYWKLLNSNIDNLLNLNNIPSIVDNYINWKNIINEYFSPKNINNLQEKFKLTKIISNSLEAKRMDIKKFTDLEKNIFSFLNNYDIRHVNYSSLTIEQLDYNMKLILCAFTLIDFNN